MQLHVRVVIRNNRIKLPEIIFNARKLFVILCMKNACCALLNMLINLRKQRILRQALTF